MESSGLPPTSLASALYARLVSPLMYHVGGYRNRDTGYGIRESPLAKPLWNIGSTFDAAHADEVEDVAAIPYRKGDWAAVLRLWRRVTCSVIARVGFEYCAAIELEAASVVCSFCFHVSFCVIGCIVDGGYYTRRKTLAVALSSCHLSCGSFLRILMIRSSTGRWNVIALM